MRRAWFFLVILLTIAACAPTFNVTMGQMPPRDPGAAIEAGMTTRGEVVEMFGQPDFKGMDADGLEKWTWTHMGVEIKAGKEANITSFFNLEVSFAGDLVSSFSYSRKAQ
ncbi:MAG: hypothetical protein P1S46_08780 [bacterium]|nr:hypothetical protein [bacterium]MDT8396169.1 hypothetical protein [bacterium]